MLSTLITHQNIDYTRQYTINITSQNAWQAYYYYYVDPCWYYPHTATDIEVVPDVPDVGISNPNMLEGLLAFNENEAPGGFH